jgi:Flp pilus assembly protein TadG
MLHARTRRRPAAALVEAAIVLPVTFFLLLGLIIGALGIFRYQEVAYLAREGARYAAVHGKKYEEEVKKPAATPADIYTNAILPRVVTLNRSHLSYSVTWDKSNAPYTVSNDYEKATTNTVSVTVTYQWFPELFLKGPYTLSSTSTLPMAY